MLKISEPLAGFDFWLKEAEELKEPHPEAFALATSNENAFPSVRMLLFKERKNEKFYFYTNYASRKAKEADSNSQGAMLFFWHGLFRQIRIEGPLSRASSEESDNYWKTRPRGSQIGAWASKQSSVQVNSEEFQSRVIEYEKKFEGLPIPRPAFWGGYFLSAKSLEFWQGHEYRLHERLVFSRKNDKWESKVLFP